MHRQIQVNMSLIPSPRVSKVAMMPNLHDGVIKWKHFPCYWPFVRGIHWASVNSQHKGQWHRALIFSLVCAWTNRWTNNGDAGDLRHNGSHYDVIVMAAPLAVAVLEWRQSRALEDAEFSAYTLIVNITAKQNKIVSISPSEHLYYKSHRVLLYSLHVW